MVQLLVGGAWEFWAGPSGVMKFCRLSDPLWQDLSLEVQPAAAALRVTPNCNPTDPKARQCSALSLLFL